LRSPANSGRSTPEAKRKGQCALHLVQGLVVPGRVIKSTKGRGQHEREVLEALLQGRYGGPDWPVDCRLSPDHRCAERDRRVRLGADPRVSHGYAGGAHDYHRQPVSERGTHRRRVTISCGYGCRHTIAKDQPCSYGIVRAFRGSGVNPTSADRHAAWDLRRY
jgi:hypothetical protein